jgi:phosphate transport system permease protein
MEQTSAYITKKRSFIPDLFTERGTFFWVTALMAMITAGSVVTIFIFLVSESLPILKETGWAFLFGNEWYAGEVYGVLPIVYGSLIVTSIALIIALPFAIGGAIFTAEFLPRRLRLLVKSIMELLAGVPGIIYGLIGISILAPLIQNIFGLIDGSSMVTAGILLAIMILPTIMSLSEDAMRAVSGEYRDAGLSLGLTKIELVFRVVLPKALPGIAGLFYLALVERWEKQ